MSVLKRVPKSKRGSLCRILAGLLLAGLAFEGRATIYTLTDGDSAVLVNDASGSGSAYNWTVGGVNQLNNQWFYYRIGSGAQEYAIDSISAPTSILDLNGKGLTTTYANGTISVQVYFSLVDSLNPGESHFNQVVTVNNLSGASMSLNLFQYSDYNLGGDPNDQSAQFYLSGGKYRNLVQTDGGWTLTETVNPPISPSTTVLVAAVSDGSILTSLTDGSVTTLPNDTSEGPGDITYAFQWQSTIATGGSLQLSKLQGVVLVPEPSSLVLISLGGCFIIGMLRRRWAV